MSRQRLRATVVMTAGCLALSTLLSAEPSTLVTTAPVVWQPESPVTATAKPAPVSAPIAPVIDRGARVRVTANGVAIADAEVSITDGSRPTLATVITDRDGIARLPELAPGPYELWARRDSQVSQLARVSDPAGELALELAPASTLHGQLVGDVRDATVTAIPVDVDHVARVASVDASGRFAIAGLPAGRWRIEGVAQGHVQAGDDIVDVRAARATVAVRMIRTGVASGLVLDGNGAPVANATIVLRSQDARFDDHPTIETSTRRRWVHPLAGRRILPGADILKFGAPRAGVRNPECGQGHCGVDIGWQRGTIVHAAADGEVVIAFSESHGEAGRAIAIDHGDDIRTYYMHLDELRPGLEPGMRVRAGDALGTIGETGAARGPHLHFALTQERDGRTFYLDPEPILRHAVVLPEARALDVIDARDAPLIASSLPGSPGQRTVSRSFSTDSNGRFRIDNVAPGNYVAVAFASTLAPGTSTPFTVRSAGETGDVAIAMHPGVAVQGRVVGRDGPVGGALIVANAGTGEAMQKVAATRTTAQGDFTLRALSGSITLAVSAPGHGVAERAITLGDRGATRREDFSLRIENSQLRGQVIAPDGGPAGKVALRVVDGPTRRQALTDATGRFTIDHAAAGTYVLEVVSADYPTTRVTTESDRFTEIRLERGGSAVVDLRDSHNGASLANIRVDATGPGGRTASITTDARGQATLRGLVAGEWTIRVRGRGYTQLQRAIAVRASAVPTDVRLDLARSATLAGIVRDRYGRRVANAKVTADGVSTQTDADGTFRITDAPAGSYWIEAELDGFRGATQVQLDPGAERQAVDIVIAN